MPWCIWLFCSSTLQQFWCWILLSNAMRHFTLWYNFADVSQGPAASIVVVMLDTVVSFNQSICSVNVMKLLRPCCTCSVKTRVIPFLRLHGTCDRKCYTKFWSISLTLKHPQYAKFSVTFSKMSVLNNEFLLKRGLRRLEMHNLQFHVIRSRCMASVYSAQPSVRGRN